MAKTITLSSEFWGDSFMDDLTPDEKLFYFAVLTNERTSNCGCYEITAKQLSELTNITQNCVKDLIKRFETEYKKIRYCNETKEMLILNWHKYHWTTSPTFLQSVLNEAENIKNDCFKDFIVTLVNDPNSTFNATKKEIKVAGKANKKPTEKYPFEGTVFFQNDEYLDTKFHEYLKSCKELGKPKKTKQAITMAMNALSKHCSNNGMFYADYAVELLQSSIEHQWLSVADPSWKGVPHPPWAMASGSGSNINWGNIS